MDIKRKGAVKMPGMLYHLVFAKESFRGFQEKLPLTFRRQYLEKYALGSLIPDWAEDKEKSHFRIVHACGHKVPNLLLAEPMLFDPFHPAVLGAYAHLYLDQRFIVEFLTPAFSWDFKKRLIENPRTGQIWTCDEFFSPKGLYRGYSECNWRMIDDGLISQEELMQLPDKLPDLPMEPLKKLLSKRTRPGTVETELLSWKEEASFYLSKRREYTGSVLEYEPLLEFLLRVADDFGRKTRAQIAYMSLQEHCLKQGH